VAFNQNIPQPTDIPANSQPQLLANFQGINTLVNVNHVGFDLADQGKHKWVTMPDQGVTNPSTLATEIATYCITSADSGNLELTFRRPSDGDIIAMTAKSGTTNGWTMLPSGILIKWATGAGTGAFTVNANSFGKAFTNILFAQVNNADTSYNTAYVYGTRTAPVFPATTTTSISIVCMSRSSSSTPIAANYSWIAIGV
jgi:hypothetical protein